ncbi:MAG: type IV secretory system conjugative DNA transfer family protein, partial [Alphaproteobacteria bacterium]
MIEWFRQLGRASRNLGRIARRNPVWAVQRLIFAPFRFARHLFGVLLLMVAVTVVLILGSDAVMWYFGLLRYPTLVAIVQVLIWLAVLLVPLRAL